MKQFFFILFNYAYQVKKAIKLRKFSINFLLYFIQYFIDNKNDEKSHLIRELPWITYEAFYFLKSLDLSKAKVFEFGSGGSTLFFAKCVDSIYSIEHDKEWYNFLKLNLDETNFNLRNIDLKLIEPELIDMETLVPSISDKKYKNFDFKKYADSISSFPDSFFDLVVIDGRARSYCLMNSFSKVKQGGYILFDNANREHYQVELSKIRNWLVLESYGPTVLDLSFNQTNIYQKPFLT